MQGAILTFHAVLHLLQVAQGNPHQAGVQHQLISVRRPHVLGGGVDKENPGVPCRDLVVADQGVPKAADHHFVPTIQEDFMSHDIFAFEVPPDSDLKRKEARV